MKKIIVLRKKTPILTAVNDKVLRPAIKILALCRSSYDIKVLLNFFHTYQVAHMLTLLEMAIAMMSQMFLFVNLMEEIVVCQKQTKNIAMNAFALKMTIKEIA